MVAEGSNHPGFCLASAKPVQSWAGLRQGSSGTIPDRHVCSIALPGSRKHGYHQGCDSNRPCVETLDLASLTVRCPKSAGIPSTLAHLRIKRLWLLRYHRLGSTRAKGYLTSCEQEHGCDRDRYSSSFWC